MKSRTCIRCGETKPLGDFSSTSKYWPCTACCAAHPDQFGGRNNPYQGSGKISGVPEEDRPLMTMIRERLKEARKDAIRDVHPLPDMDDVYLYWLFKKQQGRCALLGERIAIERAHPLRPALNRIDPARSYLRDNVQWVTWVANRAKGNLTMEDFYRMCELALALRDRKERADTTPTLPGSISED